MIPVLDEALTIVRDWRGDKGGEISGCLHDFVKHGRVKLEYMEYIYIPFRYSFFSVWSFTALDLEGAVFEISWAVKILNGLGRLN